MSLSRRAAYWVMVRGATCQIGSGKLVGDLAPTSQEFRQQTARLARWSQEAQIKMDLESANLMPVTSYSPNSRVSLLGFSERSFCDDGGYGLLLACRPWQVRCGKPPAACGRLELELGKQAPTLLIRFLVAALNRWIWKNASRDVNTSASMLFEQLDHGGSYSWLRP